MHAPDAQAWDDFVARHPAGHILQTPAWGQLKESFGWRSQWVTLAGDPGQIAAGALALYRPLPLGLGRIAYVPKGPLLDWEYSGGVAEALMSALHRAARKQRAILHKLEPDLPDAPQWRARLRALGFRPSPQGVQPRRTLIVNLEAEEEDILRAMKQKTRYNVRLAARKGVAVRQGRGEADLALFNALMSATAARDDFRVHEPAYYRRAWELFAPAGRAALFLAEFEGAALAGVMVFALGARAWYFYGASANERRNLMAPYALQWAAMRWARGRGCRTYDLWGVPDEDKATLEAEFTHRSDGLWGVYRFKRGFGGRLTRSVGAWDKVYRPGRYALYRLALLLRRSG